MTRAIARTTRALREDIVSPGGRGGREARGPRVHWGRYLRWYEHNFTHRYLYCHKSLPFQSQIVTLPNGYTSLHLPNCTHRYTFHGVRMVTKTRPRKWKNKIWSLPGGIFSPPHFSTREIFHKVPVRKSFLRGAKPTGEKFFRFWARRTRERDKGRGHTWPRPRSISPRSYPRWIPASLPQNLPIRLLSSHSSLELS